MPSATSAKTAVAPPATAWPWARRLPWVLLAVLLPLLLCALLHRWDQQPEAVDPRLLQLWQATATEGAGLQPPDRLGRPAELPLRLSPAGAGNTAAQPLWLQLSLPPLPASEGVWTLTLRHQGAVLVLLDGELVAHSSPPLGGELAPEAFKLGAATLQVDLPPARLQGSGHRLAIRLGPAGPAGAHLGRLWLGPQAAVGERRHREALRTLPRELTTAAAAVAGLFLVLLWTLSRHDWLYGLAGAHLLLLALLLSAWLPEVPPLPDPWWRLLLDVADVLAKALLLGIVARLALARPAPVLRAALAYAVAGVLIDGLAATQSWAWSNFHHPWAWWALGSRAAVLATAWALALLAVWRRPHAETEGTACAVGLSASIWAYVSWFVLVQPQRLSVSDLNYVAHAGWVLLLGALLLLRFAGSVRREARLRDGLARQLAERTASLQASFEALRGSELARATAERAGAVAAERERLMQEMHDGIGAQLIATRLQVAAGTLAPAQAAALIDDCLRELRLTVDALSLDDGDLGALLGALRQRLVPGLQAAGIHLHWQVAATPPLPVLQGAGGRELLRLVQEAVSNVLHHAQASELRVATVVLAGVVQLSITDNGRGRAADAPAGRGTQSMRSRAQRLGATLAWHSPPPGGGPGTSVCLRLPLPPGG